MKLHNRLLLLTTLMVALFSGWCTREAPKPENKVSALVNEVKSTAPQRLPAGSGEEVTFFPTYGYREGNGWNIKVRGWVHQDRSHLNKIVTKLMTALATVKNKCDSTEMTNFQSRSSDFEDDDKSLEKVIIKFDSDPDAKLYEFNRRSDANGIVVLDLTLTDDRAKQLLVSENSANGWLTFSAASGEHTGRGRIRLIEPDGVSLISVLTTPSRSLTSHPVQTPSLEIPSAGISYLCRKWRKATTIWATFPYIIFLGDRSRCLGRSMIF